MTPNASAAPAPSGSSTSSASTLVDVALPVPLPELFSYRLPPGLNAAIGARVRVPFGPRSLVGVVIGPSSPERAANLKLRDISEVLDATPLLSPACLALAQWLADYWFAPPGEAVALLMPPRMADGAAAPAPKHHRTVSLAPSPSSSPPAPSQLGPRARAALDWLGAHGETPLADLREVTEISLDSLRRLAARGLVILHDTPATREPLALETPLSSKAPPLTTAQTAAIAEIIPAFGTFRGFLLHGVTGSGKTEVYLALIEAVLARQQSALVLVPEIALTPQLAARFRARLGARVAVQHSGLDPLARHEQWLRIQSGELPVVVGARSALFAPLPRLGLIVVDEEHESSFKQDTSPRYHARDLALVRGHLERVPVVLGSATPSLESWVNVARAKLTYLTLPDRAHQARPLPEVAIVDLRNAPMAPASQGARPSRLISQALADALHATVAAHQQALIFLNRRGYASALQCRGCGEPITCTACSVALTWHRRRGRLLCHTCDASCARPTACPRCQSPALVEIGAGTEHIEAELAALLPAARIARMDRDTTRGAALVSLLDRVRAHEIDVLVGTQMLAKGHDFPNVTLVGVLSAEHGLGFPDFRAAERTCQLLTQIAGRAGRGSEPGRVIVQTCLPDHYAITHALTHDVVGFLETEHALRQARAFPPEAHLALFRVSGPEERQTFTAAYALEAALSTAAAGLDVTVFPTQPAPVERIKDRFRAQILLRSAQRATLRRLLVQTRPVWAARPPHGLLISLDVDPMQFL